MARAVCTTLGPFGTAVLSVSSGTDRRVESLTGGGLVARRIVECGHDVFENMGAMLVRHAVCRVDHDVGDATATTAATFDKLLQELVRLIDSGRDPVSLSDDLRACGASAIARVDDELLSLDREAAARSVVTAALHDDQLADTASDLLVGVGADGHVDVRQSRRSEATHEFVEGARWRTQDTRARGASLCEFNAARVAVSDDSIEDVAALGALVEFEARRGTQTLLVVCRSASPEVRRRVEAAPGPRVITVVPSANDTLSDVAAYCGTRVASSISGTHLADPSWRLGAVRRGWVTSSEFGLFPVEPTRNLTDHVSRLRAAFEVSDDQAERIELRQRFARLEGRSALLAIPIGLAAERDDRVRRVRSALESGRAALVGGVVAGGGSTLVRAGNGPVPPGVDPVIGRALARALEEPARRILRSAALDPDLSLDRMRRSASERVDVRTGTWLDAAAADVVDPAPAVRCAIETAVSVACTIALAEVLVRVREPALSIEP